MLYTGLRTRARCRASALLPAAVCAVAVAVCNGGVARASGHTHAASSINLAVAKADVKKYAATPAWKAPGPPINGKKLRGKTCAYVPINGSILFTKYSYAGFQSAAKVAGIKTHFFSTDGTNTSFTSAIDEAVAANVNCIVTQGVDLALLGSAVAKANQAHIPLIESFVNEPSKGPNKGAFAEVSPNDLVSGYALGAYAALRSKGHVNSVYFEVSTDPQTVVIGKGVQAELKKICPKTCHVKFMNVETSDWATKLGPETSSYLTAHPSTNWLFPTADGEVGYMLPAISQGGFTKSVQMGSTNATVGVMTDVAKHNVLTADVGQPYLWYGFNLMDEALRSMAHMKAAPAMKEVVPSVLFDSQNFTSATNKEAPNKWYGKALAAVPRDYAKLWGDS